jgi:arylsulfatase A
LKAKGYQTCVAGKWQLGGNAGTIRDFGFDRHCLWNMLNYTALDTTEVSPVKSMLNRYKNPTLYRDGKWHKPGPDAFGPSECTDFICEFIDKNAAKPFLAYYPMILTHSPFVPAPGKTGKNKKANFVSMTEYMDHLLGRIIATLDKNGIREKTMIIFTGDNGTHVSITSGTGKGPVRGGKAKMTNAGTHVPFIVNWPGVIKPAKSDELVDFSDVLPTLAQAAGVDIPKNVDGLSLLPVLRGETASRRDTAFCYYISKSPKTADRHFVRNRQYKLYGSGEFFKVRADPLEKSPITDPTAEEAVVKQALQTAADRYLKTR